MDDAPANRMQYQAEFTARGFEVITTTSDCEDFLETIMRHNPDLIILRIKTGKVNELKTIENIRDNGHEVPVILSTEYAGKEVFRKSAACLLS